MLTSTNRAMLRTLGEQVIRRGRIADLPFSRVLITFHVPTIRTVRFGPAKPFPLGHSVYTWEMNCRSERRMMALSS